MKKYILFALFSFSVVHGQQDNPFYGEVAEDDRNVTQAAGGGPGGAPGDGDPLASIDDHIGVLLVVALTATYYCGRKLATTRDTTK